MQVGVRVTWETPAGRLRGRIVGFDHQAGGAYAVVDVLPYRSKRLRQVVLLHLLTCEPA
jgi:hypothetical protein